MSKYIKLEDALEAYNQAVTILVESEMEEFDLGDFTECSFNTTQIKLIERMIASLPTIDIVRCKDCKHNPKRTNDFAYGRCVCCCEDDWYGYVPDDDFFCGHGERKDNE